MAFERRLQAVTPVFFTANGTQFGVVTVADTAGFKVKQVVALKSDALQSRSLQVKRVLSNTQFVVGLNDNKIGPQYYADISEFLVSDNAFISAEEQDKVNIPDVDHYRAVYEADPTVADRVIQVDKYGRFYDQNNRLPVDAELTVESLNVNLDSLTPPNKPDPDNVLISGSEDGTKGSIKRAARVDSSLDLRVGISNGSNKANVDVIGNLSVKDDQAAAILVAIQNQLNAGILKVDDDEAQVLLNTIANILSSGSIQIGTEDGTLSGIPRVFVNNLKKQILDSDDRDQNIVYADFGTKNQRIIQIDYSSSKIGPFIARKTISYTLVGTRYRRDSIDWSII